jgi:hypothetical protein
LKAYIVQAGAAIATRGEAKRPARVNVFMIRALVIDWKENGRVHATSTL